MHQVFNIGLEAEFRGIDPAAALYTGTLTTGMGLLTPQLNKSRRDRYLARVL